MSGITFPLLIAAQLGLAQPDTLLPIKTDTLPSPVGEVVFRVKNEPMPYDSGFAVSYRQFSLWYYRGDIEHSVIRSTPPETIDVYIRPSEQKGMNKAFGVLAGLGVLIGLAIGLNL